VSRRRDAGLFLALGAVWGVSFPAVEVGLRGVTPLALAASRYYLAAAVLVPALLVVRGRDALPAGRGDAAAVAAGGGLLVAGNGLLFLGQQFTTGGVASVVFGLVPVLTAGGGALLLGTGAPDAAELAGVALGVAGVALVASPGTAGAAPRGVALVAGAVVAVSAGNVLVERAAPESDGLTVAAWSMLLGGAVIHAAARATGESLRAVAAADPAPLAALAFLALAASAFAYAVYFTLLARVGSFRVSLVSYLVPVVATVVGVVALAEPVGPATVGGFLLVAGGFALVQHAQVRAALQPLRGVFLD
jgi:drug/metabolite transporter (DMT)-like permease